MKEDLKEEKENFFEESEKKDCDKEIKNEEQKDEIKENKKELLINPKENIDLESLEDGNFNGRKFNTFLYNIPEVIFNICFFLGIIYKQLSNMFLILPYCTPILVFYYSFSSNKKLLLNNYLLLSKLTSIEILIFYPIFIINERDKNLEDLVFIIIFILGALSGLFSLIYLFLYFYIFQNGLSEFKKIYFLYLELIAILLMHPLLIYTYYMDWIGSHNSIGEIIVMFFKIFIIFVFELLLFLLNLDFLCNKVDSDNCIYKIIMAILKILLYISVELLLLNLYEKDKFINVIYISSIFRMFFMVISLFFLFLIK